MKKLFLSSHLASVKNLLSSFLEEHSQSKEIVFMSTAANPESYTAYVDEARETFEHLGYRLTNLDISRMEAGAIIAILETCTCLYVSGGNTFYLLEELKKKDLLPYLREKILSGMLYVGESAGAIILAADIGYAHLLDDTSVADCLTDYHALDVIDFYLLPHFQEFPFVEAGNQVLKKYGSSLDLLAISNSQAVLVFDQERQVK